MPSTLAWLVPFPVLAPPAEAPPPTRPSPPRTQGMNTGLQDATNLAWKVALAWPGACAPAAADALLQSYSAERAPVAAGVLRMSGRMVRTGGRCGWGGGGGGNPQVPAGGRGWPMAAAPQWRPSDREIARRPHRAAARPCPPAPSRRSHPEGPGGALAARARDGCDAVPQRGPARVCGDHGRWVWGRPWQAGLSEARWFVRRHACLLCVDEAHAQAERRPHTTRHTPHPHTPAAAVAAPLGAEDTIAYNSSPLLAGASSGKGAGKRARGKRAAAGPGCSVPDLPVIIDGALRPATELLRPAAAAGGGSDGGEFGALLLAPGAPRGGWPEFFGPEAPGRRLAVVRLGAGPGGVADPAGRLAAALGLGEAGGALVRPDGVVAAVGGPDVLRGWLERHLPADGGGGGGGGSGGGTAKVAG
jgi:hypothetical protein